MESWRLQEVIHDLVSYGTRDEDDKIMRIPFNFLTNPSRPVTPIDQKCFNHLFSLPLELVFLILKVAVPATQFSWMKTNRFFRSVAEKYFWSNPYIWYEIPPSWLEAAQINRLHQSGIDMTFAKYVTQISIMISGLAWGRVIDENPRSVVKLPLQNRTVQTFWERITASLPAARYILLRTNFLDCNPHDDMETDIDHIDVCLVLQGAPTGINVIFASAFNTKFFNDGDFWRLNAAKTNIELDKHARIPSFIRPPRRRISNGPLGDWLTEKTLHFLVDCDWVGVHELRFKSHFPSPAAVEYYKCPSEMQCGDHCYKRWELDMSTRTRPDCPRVATQVVGKFTPPGTKKRHRAKRST
jgi:hypothetical protein